MNFKRGRRALALTLALAAGTIGLAACSNVKTYSSQCAYIIHNGYFDAHHVEQILLPGQQSHKSNTTPRYVYCNARNFIVKPGAGDLTTPIQAKTAAATNGDGTPVDVQLSAYFTLNESKNALDAFLPFCEKYNCFSPKDTANNSDLDHSSSPGWNNMLQENFPNAITRATQDAMLQFPTNVWNDTSQWPKVADAIAAEFQSQMQIQTGSSIPFFCGQGATTSKCPPVRFSVEHIDPTDSAIRTTYNQQVEQQYEQQLAEQQGKTNAAQLKAAKEKYGPLANQILGELDTIAACKGATSQCIVSLGSGAPTVSAK